MGWLLSRSLGLRRPCQTPSSTTHLLHDFENSCIHGVYRFVTYRVQVIRLPYLMGGETLI